MSDPYRLLPQHPLTNAQLEKQYFKSLERAKARAERRERWQSLLRALRNG